MLGEASHQDAGLPERLKQPRCVRRPHQTEQRRAADQTEPRSRQQSIEPARGFGQRLARRLPPGGIRQRLGADGDGHARHRPRAQRRREPRGDVRRRERKTQPHARQPVELAERAQHDNVALFDIFTEARAVGADIHERLVDQQQSAAPPQTIGEREQRVLGDDPAIGIVGIDDDGNARIGKLADFGHLDHVMAGELRHAAVLGVSGRKHRGAAAGQQKGRLRHENLRAGPGGHMGRRRDAIGFGRDRDQPGERLGLRQARENIGLKLRDRVVIGIDPGRQVEERFGRAGK